VITPAWPAAYFNADAPEQAGVNPFDFIEYCQCIVGRIRFETHDNPWYSVT
jgi:hypothetical protein